MRRSRAFPSRPTPLPLQLTSRPAWRRVPVEEWPSAVYHSAVVPGTFTGTESAEGGLGRPVGIDHLGLAYAARPMASGLVRLIIWSGT